MGESDYLPENAFVEAFLYEKKMDIFPFFFFSRMFFFPQISVLIETNPSLGKNISPLHGVF
jgi:hypothetical protein